MLLLAGMISGFAQTVRIKQASLTANGQVRIEVDSPAVGELILLHGITVNSIRNPVATQNVQPGPTVFLHTPPLGTTANFYRVEQQAELSLTRLSETSPAHGESGVSVTRETVFRLSQPLAADTMLSQNVLYASFGGRKLLSRAQLSSDRKAVTLFYLENLPGSARVRVTFDGNQLKDSLGRTVDLDGDGNPGGIAIIDFDTFSTTPLAGTAITGQVFASEPVPSAISDLPSANPGFTNRPLAGVTITVDGMEETLRAVTDANGFFRLSPCPAGDFFVHIDGRTVTNLAAGIHYPDLAYYPFVGKVWHAVAGRTNNLAGGTGEIFLPLITRGTLQPVSLTNDTVITFPAEVLQQNTNLAGVSITVPANSLFSPNGTRGGSVGIAPVPPDRLPGPLPPGLNFPLVITVQTDGAENFDRPIPVRFPNLPDPITGKKLAPGEKTALWSFDHDTGQWEIQGSMTITADGMFAEADPGVGIRQPGWHGVSPAAQLLANLRSAGRIFAALDSSLWASVIAYFDPAWARAIYDQTARDLTHEEFIRLFGSLHLLKASGQPARTLIDQYLKNLKVLGLPIRSGDFSTGLELMAQARLAQNDTDRAAILQRAVAWFEEKLAAQNKLAGVAIKLGKWIDTFFTVEAGLQNLFGSSGELVTAADPYKNAVNSVNQAVFDLAKRVHDSLGVLIQETDPMAAHLADSWEDFGQAQQLVMQSLSQLSNATLLDNASARLLDSQRTLADFERDLAAITFGQLDAFISASDQLETLLDSVPDAWALPASAPFVRIEGPIGAPIQRLRPARFSELDAFLAPGTGYRISVFDSVGFGIGETFVITPDAGQITTVRVFVSRSPTADDSDNDGIPDEGEMIIGLNPANPDTDGDGIPDGVEVQQGTDPLDGQPVITGVIASADTPGNAVDVCVENGVAAVADSEGGVVLFNAINSSNPVRVAQVPTPGPATRIACSENFVAAACGDAGLAVIDVSSIADARVLRQVTLGSAIRAVCAASGIAYVGAADGTLAAVDMETGAILDRVSIGGDVHDLKLSGDYLILLRSDELQVWQFAGGLQREGSIQVSSNPPEGITGRKRLFVGGSVAYVTSYPGYETISLGDPAAPARIAPVKDVGPNSFKQIALNGSGLGIAAVGVNPRDDGTHDVSLYDVSSPGNTTAFLTTLRTPGIAQALSIYNGLAYVADGSAGLQVVNYRAYDNLRVPPTISLTTSFPLLGPTNGVAESGKPVLLSATCTDDVQVRNVEFYVDGSLAGTDVNFPFEHRFLAQALGPGRTNFTVRARATDTGGNFTWTPEINVALTPDATPPRIRRSVPGTNSVVSSSEAVFVFFSEPVDTNTITTANFSLTWAGPDLKLDTTDDQLLTGAQVEWRDTFRAAALRFPTALNDGLYRASVTGRITDNSGNELASPLIWTFWILPGGADGDADGDGLTNQDEANRGTNPFDRDTDGDGWNDWVEIVDETDPINPASKPQMVVLARPPVELSVSVSGGERPLVLARPPLEIVLPLSGGERGVYLATPPVELVLPAAGGETGLFLARPPLELVLSASGGEAGAFLARPPVEIGFGSTVLQSTLKRFDDTKPSPLRLSPKPNPSDSHE